MKKWLIRISLCLLLGVVTTVGVAWGLGAATRFDLAAGANVDTLVFFECDEFDVTGTISRGFGVEHVVLNFWPPNWSHINEWRAASKPGGWVRRAIANHGDELDRYAMMGCGFPSIAFECDWADSWRIRGGVELTDLRGLRWRPALPQRVFLPGFIINTLFYAAIWFVLIFGWRAHMRLVRRWQGYCPMCKYDLRGDMEHGCSECGWKRYS